MSLVLRTRSPSANWWSSACPLKAARAFSSTSRALAQRRSCRRFAPRKLTPAQIGQIAWAAQGVTGPGRGYRAAPSAGALYPMELYLVGPDGVHHYAPSGHRLDPHQRGDVRGELAKAALGQDFVRQAPLTVVISAVHDRVTRKYGQRGVMYVHMEAGHIAQNVHLQSVALGLGSVPVGAFHPSQVAEVLSLPKDREPLYLIPVGYPATR